MAWTSVRLRASQGEYPLFDHELNIGIKESGQPHVLIVECGNHTPKGVLNKRSPPSHASRLCTIALINKGRLLTAKRIPFQI